MKDTAGTTVGAAAGVGIGYMIWKVGKTAVLTAVGGPTGFADGVATP